MAKQALVAAAVSLNVCLHVIGKTLSLPLSQPRPCEQIFLVGWMTRDFLHELMECLPLENGL